MRLPYSELVDAVDQSRGLIVDAIRDGDPDAIVPTCPEFTLDRLAFHIGEFSSFWSHVVCEGNGRDKPAYPADPGAAGRGPWVDGLMSHLVTELRSAKPDTPCWTWYEPDQSVGFVASRACHELTIHRVDAQLAAGGTADGVPAPVAVAGIEEVFLLLHEYGVDGVRGVPGNGETLHLCATDTTSDEWWVHLDADQATVTRDHNAVRPAADLSIRASASDLELLLYQRPTTGPVEMIGDRAVLDVFYGEFTFT